MKKSAVFEETYNNYLSRISDIDLLPRAARLGAEPAGDARKAVELLAKSVRVAEETTGYLGEKEVDIAEHRLKVDMKLISLFKSAEKATIKLSENQIFSVRGKNIQINCSYGVLWVTWPKRGERILEGGQTFRVSSKGKVCIVALSNAFFLMSKK